MLRDRLSIIRRLNMDELREKIEKYLRLLGANWDSYTLGEFEVNPITYNQATDQILTLFKDWFKEKIEALEVIEDEEILDASQVATFNEDGSLAQAGYLTGRCQVAQSQLKDSKDRLLEVLK